MTIVSLITKSILTSSLPELFLLLMTVLLLFIGFNIKLQNNQKYNYYILLKYLLLVILTIVFTIILYINSIDYFNINTTLYLFNFFFKKNLFNLYIILFLLTLFLIYIIYICANIYTNNYFYYKIDYIYIYILILIGCILLLLVNDFFLFFLIFELISLGIYVLIATNLKSNLAVESSLKYYIIGTISSVFMLLSISLIYGILCTTNFNDLYNLLFFINFAEDMIGKYILIAIFLFLLSIFFKLGLFPFHFWLPVIYENISYKILLFLFIIPKSTYIFISISLLYGTFFYSIDYLINYIYIFAILSILVGSFCAIYQKNLKKLLSFSSINNIGYIVLIIALYSSYSILNLSFYIFLYILNLFLFFFLIQFFKKLNNYNEIHINNINEFSNLFKLNSKIILILTFIIFSIAGLPPFLGFYPKYMLLIEMLNNNLILFSLLILLTTLISTYYYIKLIKIFFFNKNLKNNYYYFLKNNSIYLNILQKKNNFIFFFIIFNFILNIFFMLYQFIIYYIFYFLIYVEYNNINHINIIKNTNNNFISNDIIQDSVIEDNTLKQNIITEITETKQNTVIEDNKLKQDIIIENNKLEQNNNAVVKEYDLSKYKKDWIAREKLKKEIVYFNDILFIKRNCAIAGSAKHVLKKYKMLYDEISTKPSIGQEIIDCLKMFLPSDNLSRFQKKTVLEIKDDLDERYLMLKIYDILYNSPQFSNAIERTSKFMIARLIEENNKKEILEIYNKKLSNLKLMYNTVILDIGKDIMIEESNLYIDYLCYEYLFKARYCGKLAKFKEQLAREDLKAHYYVNLILENPSKLQVKYNLYHDNFSKYMFKGIQMKNELKSIKNDNLVFNHLTFKWFYSQIYYFSNRESTIDQDIHCRIIHRKYLKSREDWGRIKAEVVYFRKFYQQLYSHNIWPDYILTLGVFKTKNEHYTPVFHGPYELDKTKTILTYNSFYYKDGTFKFNEVVSEFERYLVYGEVKNIYKRDIEILHMSLEEIAQLDEKEQIRFHELMRLDAKPIKPKYFYYYREKKD